MTINHNLIRRRAEHGEFSPEVAEQIIRAGCPSKLAWRTYTVSLGRRCSIAEAFEFVSREQSNVGSVGRIKSPTAARNTPAPKASSQAPQATAMTTEERMASWRATQQLVKAEMRIGEKRK